MARYEVQGPDGGRYEVEAPDHYTPEQVTSLVRQQLGQRTASRSEMRLPGPAGPGRLQEPAPEQMTAGEDIGRALASGYIKGGLGLASLPGLVEQVGRYGINKAGQAITGQNAPIVDPEPALPTYSGMKAGLERIRGAPLYEPQRTSAKYAQTIGEFAPGMVVGGAGGMGTRIMRNVVAPAVGAETAGQLTEGTAAEPYARVAGALAGGMVPSVAGRVVTPLPMDAERARHVASLRAEGTKLTAGDVTGSNVLKYAESAARDTPLAMKPAERLFQERAASFTAAIVKKAVPQEARQNLLKQGINPNLATSEVLDESFRALGKRFDEIAAKAKIDPTLMTFSRRQSVIRNMQSVIDGYNDVTAAGMRAGLPESIATEFIGMMQAGKTMSGGAYTRWRSDIERAARSAPPPVASVLRDIKDVLDDAVQHSLQREWKQRWMDTRRKYRNMIVVEQAASRAGENPAIGLITPAGLQAAVKSKHGLRNYSRGRGDYAELARSGPAVMRDMPQSGTAPRAMIHGLGAALGAGMGAAAGGPWGAGAGAVLGPMIGQAAGARAVVHPWVQQYLANQQMARPINALMTARDIRQQIPGTIVQGQD